MTLGRRHAAALLGLGALGAAAAAFFVGGSAAARRAAAATASQKAVMDAQVAIAVSARDLADEAVAAGAVPELNAAIRDKVAASKLDDLFQREAWWAPHRARAVVIVGPEGVVMSHNLRSGPAAAAVLAARAGDHHTVRLARTGDEVYLVAAGAVLVPGTVVAPDAPSRAIALGIPVDDTLVDQWAANAQAGLLIVDGHGFERAGGTPRPTRADLAGHEADPVVVDEKDGWIAGSADLGEGLRLWAARPAVLAKPGKVPVLPLGGLAAVLALCAVGVLLSGRKRANEG